MIRRIHMWLRKIAPRGAIVAEVVLVEIASTVDLGRIADAVDDALRGDRSLETVH